MSEARTASKRVARPVWEGVGALMRGVFICLLAGGFLAVAGAFGSGAAPFTTRLVYWVGMMFAGSALGTVIARPVRQTVCPDTPSTRLMSGTPLGR